MLGSSESSGGAGKAETELQWEAIAQHCWSTRRAKPVTETSSKGSKPPPPPRATCSQLQVLQAFSWEGCKEEEGRRERGKAGQASTQLQAEGGLSPVHKY